MALAEARRERNRRDGKTTRMSAEARAFEAIIRRAANLVFATTNSAAVEQLIEERGLFDWTIVEEAGKATGAELLSPLLLSHRRLMVGDHRQLNAKIGYDKDPAGWCGSMWHFLGPDHPPMIKRALLSKDQPKQCPA
jgi:superfamily I DNA and/or RNA helicase